MTGIKQPKPDTERPWRAALGPLGTPMRFGPLLLLLLATVIFQLAAPDTDWTRFIAIVLLAGTLLLTLWAADVSERTQTIAAGLAGVIVLLSAGALFGPEDVSPDTVSGSQLILIAVVPTTIAIAVLRDLRDTGRVTLRAVAGVLCIYLVVGMAFAYVAQLIEAISSEPYFSEVARGSVSDFLFFSYSTLTTVGYGDLTVANQAGRALAVAEALIGQIYVITVVAIIIGNLGSGRRSRSADEPPR